jgi:hypothetical protein
MDAMTILQQLDIERQTVADSDARLERSPYVVRSIGARNRWTGVVYSRFSASETEMVIQAEIEYFTRLECAFEWKIYSHDEPPDLLTRLRKCGFGIGEEESVMVSDSGELSPLLTAPLPAGVTVTPVRDEGRIEDYLSVETAVWSCEADEMR